MRPHHRTLNRHQVHRSATKHLQEHVPLRDYKRKVTAPTLWAVLLVAAAGVTSIHAACGRLDGLASEETIRKALYASLPEFAELQRQLNRALAGRLPRALRRRPQRLAIDLTLIPYHGEPFRDPEEVYRGLAKDGTSHFHAYATAYVVLKGQRFTVALTAVAKGEPLKDVVQRLLKQARSVGVKPRLVLLDRGFYSVDVIRYLQAARLPVPDAGGDPRPQGRRPAGPERDAGVRRDEAERLVRVHGHRRHEADGDGVDLRVLPQLPRAVEAARASGAGLRVLGRGRPVVHVGAGDVPDVGSGSSRATGR